jgi:hypothetical protein
MPMLVGRVYCSRCAAQMVTGSAGGFSWYACDCPRRIAVDDLDGIAIGLTYEYRRTLGDRQSMKLDDEPAMLNELVEAVHVGLDWSRPKIDWIGAASHSHENRLHAEGVIDGLSRE